VPKDHPLQDDLRDADTALKDLDKRFDGMYAATTAKAKRSASAANRSDM